MPDNSLFEIPAISAEQALARLSQGAVLVDMRKPAARAASGKAVVAAEIRNPFTFSHDDPLTTSPLPLIVFCVHGHEVSQFGCALLLVHGRDACYVRGGFEALVAASASFEDLPQ